MMITKKLILALVMGMLVLGGCAGSLARKPNLSPSVELKPMDYKILGTVEGSGSVTTILCIFKMGGSQFGYSAAGGGSASGLSGLVASKDAVAVATYEAISKVPEADMLLPLTTMAEVSGLGCLFKTERATIRGKAIKIIE
jgi:hypothetical protein